MALYGLLGSGNIGNEGSAEAVLARLRSRPDVEVSAICAGPADVRRRWGIPAVSLCWPALDRPRGPRPVRLALKAVGKVLEPLRTTLLLRRVDLVVVPGMGVLEDSLPLNPWGMPYALLVLAMAARLTGTPVALVAVGATRPADRATRWLLGRSAALAGYRSFRDAASRAAVRGLGVDVRDDPVVPDLAFGLPLPQPVAVESASPQVAVGVMAFRGRRQDHAQGEQIQRRATDGWVEVVVRLLDDGSAVRLVTGDPADAEVARAVRDAALAARPGTPADRVVFEPAGTLCELLEQLAEVRAVVASRYHNVLCALRLGKPTVSLGYAAKNRDLMATAGLPEYALDLRTADVGEVLAALDGALARADRIHQRLATADAAATARLERQWADLDALVDGVTSRARATRGRADAPPPGSSARRAPGAPPSRPAGRRTAGAPRRR